jgi:RNA polymerase sigma factor (sigma-70 family)
MYKNAFKLIESAKFWETIYRQNIGKMIGICYRYTANRQLSEDLAHDAFLKAIDRSASFEGKGSFEAWLRRIVINHVLQYLRDQKRRKYVDDWLQHEGSTLQTEDHGSNTNQPESVEFSEKELLDVVNDLPEHHRLVFNLYVIDNFTHAQIGVELGISSGTSKSHLARARKKIKQLLTEKANKKHGRSKALILFLFSYPLQGIDRLYRKWFNNFGLSSSKIVSPDFGGTRGIPLVQPLTVTSWNYIIAAASVTLILSAGCIVFYLYQHEKIINNAAGTDLAESIVREESKHTGPTQESEEEINRSEKTADRENNSRHADSSAATISRNSVIPKTIKTKRMKSMDSLGIMLLVSSGVVFDTTAQSDHKADVPVNTQTQVTGGENQPGEAVKMIKFSGPKIKNVKSHKGTFYASSLFWSDENNELYLKGKVVVEFGDNDFIGDGTFNFLGPVSLLIFSDEPVKPGSKIKLSKQQYQLTQLSSRQATEKYGEKGRQGAVEISLVE